jgi:hypothetical protein
MRKALKENNVTTDLIDEALRRPARHWSSDGLADLFVGVLLLLWGMAISAQQLWPSTLTALLAAWVPAVTGLGLVVFSATVMRGLQTLKARWAYPRVGYVKMREASRARKTAAAVVSGVVAVVVAFAVLLSRREGADWVSLMPVGMGTVYAVGAGFLWVRFRLRRFLAYALLALVSGALAQWWLPADLGVGVVLCAVGLCSAIGGAVVLRGLLRQPTVVEDQR